MIDGPSVTVLAGLAAQAAPAACRVFVAIAPRAAAFVADLRGLSTPPDDPALDQLLASID